MTNLPSLPAKGLSLTAKVISMVGSEIFTKGSGSTHSGGAQGVADGDVRHTGQRHDITGVGGSWTGVLAQAVELVQRHDLALGWSHSRHGKSQMVTS